MNAQRLAVWGLLGLGVYLLLRNLRTPTAANATQIPDAFFRAEHAGADLYKAYGTVNPSGAARDMIR